MTITCPCGSEQAYEQCCGRYIDDEIPAPTPVTLMRSRYTAFTRANIDYIVKTMRPPASVGFNAQEASAWAQAATWVKLEVLNEATQNKKGFVEFVAHLIDQQKAEKIHERSEFHFIDGKWYYVDGKIPRTRKTPVTATKAKRNDPCPCGSGKKYKQCCGA